MALVVEDGTGRADAESYCSVAHADAYFAARGLTSWDGSDAHKEGLLRKATDYMKARYGHQWKGTRINSTQALDWPRYDVIAWGYSVDSASVPTDVKNACAEFAHRANTQDLWADRTRATKREKVDVIEVEYDTAGNRDLQYPLIDASLGHLLNLKSAAARQVVRT